VKLMRLRLGIQWIDWMNEWLHHHEAFHFHMSLSSSLHILTSLSIKNNPLVQHKDNDDNEMIVVRFLQDSKHQTELFQPSSLRLTNMELIDPSLAALMIVIGCCCCSQIE
jgi:hypothetical protein